MKDFKERIYNYEAEPPAIIWNNIREELQDESMAPKVISMPATRKRPKLIFYGLTAAASLIIIFLVSLFYNKNNNQQTATTELQQSKDSIKLNNKTLEDIIEASKENKSIVLNTKNISKIKKYITIAGPEGQPVKISPKVATLIESADNAYPPKAVWNKKIEKWKQIMLTTTLSPTSTDLMDIAQLSTTIDNNE